MNSLNELNNYGNTGVSFIDQRAPRVDFDRLVATTQSLLCEDGEFYVLPTGINVVDVIQPDIVTITYTIDVSSITGATVAWASLPADVTSSNPSTGVYEVTGINSQSDWTAVKAATVVGIPDTTLGSFEFTSTLTTSLNDEFTWTTAVTVIEQLYFSAPVNYTYNSGAVNLNFAPIFLSQKAYTFTVTATPSNITGVVSIGSTSTQGVVGVNPTTKVVVMSGLASQLVDILDKFFIEMHPDIDPDFTIEWSGLNTTTPATDTQTQNLLAPNNDYLASITTAYDYDEDINFTIKVPKIVDAAHPDTTIYTYVIKPANPNDIQTTTAVSIPATGLNPEVIVDPITPSITLIGTKTIINYYVFNTTFEFQPGSDLTSTIVMKYELTTPSSGVRVKQQNIACTTTHEETINHTLSRTYYSYTATFPFASNPITITDLEPNQFYTVEFTSQIGYFETSVDVLDHSISFTGSREAVNSWIQNLEYFGPQPSTIVYPEIGDPDLFEEDDTFTFKQYKNGRLQTSSSFAVGYSGVGTLEKIITITESGYWTPGFAEKTYGLYMDILLVGGGQGGGVRSGGGGGEALEIGLASNNWNLYKNRTNIPVTIGAGGVPGYMPPDLLSSSWQPLPGNYIWYNGDGTDTVFDNDPTYTASGGFATGYTRYDGDPTGSPFGQAESQFWGYGGGSRNGGAGEFLYVRYYSTTWWHGGGGGGGAGEAGGTDGQGYGGAGYISSLFFNEVTGDNYFAGGGAGESAGYGTVTGGQGGGGDQSGIATAGTVNGKPNTGGGGSWGYAYKNALPLAYQRSPGAGGSGVIKIRIT